MLTRNKNHRRKIINTVHTVRAMPNNMRKAWWLCCALFILLATSGWAQADSTQQTESNQITFDELLEDEQQINFEQDTLSIKARDFDANKLRELNESGDYNYKEAPTVGETLLERIWSWIVDAFFWLISKLTLTGTGNFFLYLLCLVVLIIIVLIVLKVDALRVLTGRTDSGVSKSVFHENIHAMDFDSLLQAALAKHDYRNAVRLVFLQSLKILADKQLIDWQAGKTNHDYLNEVQPPDVKKGLGQLSYYFDYAWYGGFSVSENQYSRVKSIFDSWRSTLS
jgi:hypothetical protein